MNHTMLSLITVRYYGLSVLWGNEHMRHYQVDIIAFFFFCIIWSKLWTYWVSRSITVLHEKIYCFIPFGDTFTASIKHNFEFRRKVNNLIWHIRFVTNVKSFYKMVVIIIYIRRFVTPSLLSICTIQFKSPLSFLFYPIRNVKFRLLIKLSEFFLFCCWLFRDDKNKKVDKFTFSSKYIL